MEILKFFQTAHKIAKEIDPAYKRGAISLDYFFDGDIGEVVVWGAVVKLSEKYLYIDIDHFSLTLEKAIEAVKEEIANGDSLFDTWN